MKRKHKWNNDEDMNYWQPTSDLFSTLTMILLLVILMLGLYLVQIPEYRLPDPEAGNTYSDDGGEDDGGGADHTATPSPTAFAWDPSGGSNTPFPDVTITPTVTPEPTLTPTPVWFTSRDAGGGDGGGEDPDKGMKSAVYVMLVDGQTDNIIKEANVQFELYEDDGALMVLNSYYPEWETYRTYETTESGYFYLPEKIPLGSYELHELTEAEGYELAENQKFDLEEVWDWDNPYVVRVPVYPSRNVIRVQARDAETGIGLAGASFEVIAAESIITADGTTRYRSGETVGEIVCDESGYGESEEMYLGSYTLRQAEIPPYYAGLREDIPVTVERKTNVGSTMCNIDYSRTRVQLTVVDELYLVRGISGAVFQVSTSQAGVLPKEYTTNSNGIITLEELEKGTVYTIRQTGTVGDFLPAKEETVVTVSSDGYIDDETETDITLMNRMIRVFIGIKDEFSNTQVQDVKLSLYDSADNLIRSWTTTGTELGITNLQPGPYYIIKDGDESNRYDIQVLDQPEIQTIMLQTSYLMKYIIIGVAAVLTLVILTVTIILLIRRRKKQKKIE